MASILSTCTFCILLSSCVVSGAEKNLPLHQIWGDYASEKDHTFLYAPASPVREPGAAEAISSSSPATEPHDPRPTQRRLAHAVVGRALQNSFIRVDNGALHDRDAQQEGPNPNGSTPTQERTWVPHEDSTALIQMAQALAMPGGELANPCVQRTETSGCTRYAMSSFFDALDRANVGAGTARITVFGNSLHASDRIVNIVRDRMQNRFGNAGQGFLLPDRLANYGSRSRTGFPARGFAPFNVVWGAKTKFPMGAAGSLHVGGHRANTSFRVEGESSLRVYVLAHPRGGTLRIFTDTHAESFSLRAPQQEGRVLEFALPPDAKTVHLESRGNQTPVFGASLEGAGSGVTLDTLAIIGADSTRYLRSDEVLFRSQLQSLQPDLVTVFLGGNEVKRIAWGSADTKVVQRDLQKFLDRVRDARPEASCLVIGPLENVVGSQPTRRKQAPRARDPWSGRPETILVNDIMRDVAQEKGCAYFDLYAAMGSKGTMQRLHLANLLHEDMIHPKGKGLDIIGELVFDAMMEAYVSSPVAAAQGASIARTAFR